MGAGLDVGGPSNGPMKFTGKLSSPPGSGFVLDLTLHRYGHSAKAICVSAVDALAVVNLKVVLL